MEENEDDDDNEDETFAEKDEDFRVHIDTSLAPVVNDPSG